LHKEINGQTITLIPIDQRQARLCQAPQALRSRQPVLVKKIRHVK